MVVLTIVMLTIKGGGGVAREEGRAPGGAAPKGYDKYAFEPFAVTVDLAVLTVRAGALHVLLVERGQEPYAGRWALPGGFVLPRESAETAARRELAEETGLSDISGLHLEQLRTYSEPGPRPPDAGRLRRLHRPAARRCPNRAAAATRHRRGGCASTPSRPLAFDHDRILADAHERVGAKLEYTCLATAFCPPEFTLGELQQVYETVWGAALDRPNFRRKVLATPGFVEPVPGAAAPHRRTRQARRPLPGGRRHRPAPAPAAPRLGRTDPMTTTTLAKRAATGSLIGLALGDALGFPTEFNDVPVDPRQVRARGGSMALPRARDRHRRHPDDARPGAGPAHRHGPRAAGAAAAGPAGARGVRRLVPLAARTTAPPGAPACAPASCSPTAGRPWQEASQIGSKGCGANMRVAPVGLVPGLSDEQRAGAAQLQSALTHGHPTALAASRPDRPRRAGCSPGAPSRLGLLGRLRVVRVREPQPLPRALARRPVDRAASDATPEHSSRAAGTSAWPPWTASGTPCAPPRPETDPCLATGAGWIAEEALATGLLCFLLFPDEPVTALRRAACTSGDSDSIACLTGAFAGAHLGADAWPEEWADRIEYRTTCWRWGRSGTLEP